jgi:hypothetical protein
MQIPHAPASNLFLSSGGDHHAMLRVMAIVLALGVGVDHYALGGKYRRAAERIAYSVILRI